MLSWLDLAASWISPVNWAELQKRNEVNNGSKQPERGAKSEERRAKSEIFTATWHLPHDMLIILLLKWYQIRNSTRLHVRLSENSGFKKTLYRKDRAEWEQRNKGGKQSPKIRFFSFTIVSFQRLWPILTFEGWYFCPKQVKLCSNSQKKSLSSTSITLKLLQNNRKLTQFSVRPLEGRTWPDLADQEANQNQGQINLIFQDTCIKHFVYMSCRVLLPLYFLAEGMRVSLVSISSSSEIFSTVVRYSITLVSRSGRREISKMCSMYDRLSAREVSLAVLFIGNFTSDMSR